MPNVMGVLRAEIRRLARREMRDEIRGLKKQVNALRLRLAEARRRIDSVERGARETIAKGAIAAAVSRAEDSDKQARFSPVWVRKHRKRLRLSRQLYGKLVGVSAQTILAWEAGRSRPRRKVLALWRSLREKGVRELKAMLEGAAKKVGRAAAGNGRRKRRVARRRVRRTVRRVVRRAARKVARRAARKSVRRAARKSVRRAVRKVARPRGRRAKKK